MIFTLIFGYFESVSSMFLFKVITNLKFYKRRFILCDKEINRLVSIDLKIYSQERNPLTKSQDFPPNYLCDFHLRTDYCSFFAC